MSSSNTQLNVLLVGSGGREHAIAWKLAQSTRLGTLHAIPGNPGIASVARCHNVSVKDHIAVERFCRENDIGFVVVGPEDPLAAGLVDDLQKAGVKCFGPTKDAARLEADKIFAKELMRSAGVPTAESKVFTERQFDQAEHFIRRRNEPLVIKAAGLAKGKGVGVCDTPDEAVDFAKDCLRTRLFGDAGASILVEEKLEGVECSLLALIDKNDLYVLPACQDHKPIGEGNTGPMTGGMGAFCPSKQVTDKLIEQAEQKIFLPTLDALSRVGIVYRGCLYAGLMLTEDGPKVLEFNVRFGDPETQPLMMRWKGDLLEAFLAVAEGRLADFVDGGGIEWDERASLGVVLASAGYPGDYKSGEAITGLDRADQRKDVEIFHAGTARKGTHGETIVTEGGRVLCVTALGRDLSAARESAYAAAGDIDFRGVQYRRDIGENA